MCCDGDNSREIKQVRQAAQQPKTAFDTYTVPNQTHSLGVDGNEILRPLAHARHNGGAREGVGMGLRPSAVATTRSAAPPRALPDHAATGSRGDVDKNSCGVVRPRSTLISPRPRSARPQSASSDGSSSGGVSFRPPGSGLRVNSAFSHSPGSAFARAPRAGKSNVQSEMAANIDLSRHGGRTQSNFVGSDQLSDNLQRMNVHQPPAGGRGRTQSSYEPGSLYEDENIENHGGLYGHEHKGLPGYSSADIRPQGYSSANNPVANRDYLVSQDNTSGRGPRPPPYTSKGEFPAGYNRQPLNSSIV